MIKTVFTIANNLAKYSPNDPESSDALPLPSSKAESTPS